MCVLLLLLSHNKMPLVLLCATLIFLVNAVWLNGPEMGRHWADFICLKCPSSLGLSPQDRAARSPWGEAALLGTGDFSKGCHQSFLWTVKGLGWTTLMENSPSKANKGRWEKSPSQILIKHAGIILLCFEAFSHNAVPKIVNYLQFTQEFSFYNSFQTETCEHVS